MIFQRIRSRFAKKSNIFLFFKGVGPDLLSHTLWIRVCTVNSKAFASISKFTVYCFLVAVRETNINVGHEFCISGHEAFNVDHDFRTSGPRALVFHMRALWGKLNMYIYKCMKIYDIVL